MEETVGRLPAVASTETLRVLQGQNFRGERVAVAALSRGYLERALRSATALSKQGAGRVLDSIDQGAAMAVSENLAAHFDVAVGDELELATPTGTLRLEVVAVVADYVSDRGSFVVGRDLFRELWRDHLVNYISIELAPKATLDSLGVELARTAAASSLSLISTSRLVARIDGAIARAFADVAAVQLLVIVITVAGIIDLLVSSVMERRRHHAIMRAVGSPDATVIGSLVTEASAIALTAGILGVAVGAVFAWIWVRFSYPLLVGYVLRLDLDWSAAFACVFLALATAAAAAAASGAAGMRGELLEATRVD
jgi:putative ABC transport system permease protein